MQNKNKNKNKKVTKMNEVLEAIFDCTLVQYRLINLAISKVNSLSADQIDTIRISYDEYKKFFNVHPKQVINDFNEAIPSMLSLTLKLKDSNVKTGINWFARVDKELGCSYVDLTFTDQFKPYVSNVEKCFTTYSFDDLSQMRSLPQVRFFEYLHQIKNMKTSTIAIEELRKRISYPEHKLKPTSMFIKHFIEVNINKYNKETKLNACFEAVKTGRKITHLTFASYEAEDAAA